MGLNAWIHSYGRRVSVLNTQLEEHRLRGGYGGNLNLAEIITLLKSTQTEIMRQHSEIEALEEKIKVLEDELIKQNKKPQVDEITEI